MTQRQTASDYLAKKKETLEKIAARIETQCRFIQKRDMTGLKRVLRERDTLIDEIIAINQELTRDQTWKSMQRLRPIIQDIANQEQAIMDRSQQVRQEAIAERARIAAELRNSKVQQHVKNQYMSPWAVVARGSRINERG